MPVGFYHVIPNTVWVSENFPTDTQIFDQNLPVIIQQPDVLNMAQIPSDLMKATFLFPNQTQDAPLTKAQKAQLFNSLPQEDKTEIAAIAGILMNKGYSALLAGQAVSELESDTLSDNQMETLKKYKKLFESQDIKIACVKDKVPQAQVKSEDITASDDLVVRDKDYEESVRIINVPMTTFIVNTFIKTFRKANNNLDITPKNVINTLKDENDKFSIKGIKTHNIPETLLLLHGFLPTDAYFLGLSADAAKNNIDKNEVKEKYSLYASRDGDKPSNHTKVLGLINKIIDMDKLSTNGKPSKTASELILYILMSGFNTGTSEEEIERLQPAADEIDKIMEKEGMCRYMTVNFPSGWYLTWGFDIPSGEIFNQSMYTLIKKDIVIQKKYLENYNTSEKSLGFFLNNDPPPFNI